LPLFFGAIFLLEISFLFITVPPQPKEPTTLYGYVAGQAGDVVVNFTANPSPIRVYWKVEDDSQLNVVPYDGPSTNDRFEVYELKTTVRAR